MKTLLLAVALVAGCFSLVSCETAEAQVPPSTPVYTMQGTVARTDPSGACTQYQVQENVAVSPPRLWGCSIPNPALNSVGSWIQLNSGATGGTWGGITGTLSNQTDLATALGLKQAVGNYLTALSGDATAAGPSGGGSAALTLASVNSTPVTNCADATHVCQITVNAKGLITNAVSVAISASGSSYYQTFQHDGTAVTQRAKFNLAAGSGMTITATDNGTDTTTFTLASSGGSGVGSGTLASRPTCSSPSAYVATDQSRGLQFSTCDGTQWTNPGPTLGPSGNLAYSAGGAIDTTANVATLANSQTFTGLKTFSQAPVVPVATPASSSATCVAGQVEGDTAYLYFCSATNTWRRAATSSF